MDQRQTQVQVGAGLQESRLNTDLINFLQKYGSWAVYLLLAAVLLYMGNGWWKKQKEAKLDLAYADYQAAVNSSSPDGLIKVASDHSGYDAIAAMSRLDAARIYLDAARRGLKPGADSRLPAETDRLDEAGRKSMLAEATKQFDLVVGYTSLSPVLMQQALWGKATAQIDNGDTDGAIKTMQDLIDRAKANGLTDQEIKGRQRLDHIAKLGALKPVYATAELPESARPPAAPAPTSAAPNGQGIQPPPGIEAPKIINTSGAEVEVLTPEQVEKALGGRKPGQSAPVPAPEPAPAPSGTPAPQDPKPNP